MAQLGFYFDMNHCSGCKCCAVACKETKDLNVGYNYRKVTNYEGGSFPAVWAASLSLACNHCAAPACIAVCPVEAIIKDDETGLVHIDKELCIGCQSCVTGCPYGVPVFFPDEAKADKCDGCPNFLALDEKPACVAACSTRCLRFGDLAELEQEYGSTNPVKDLSVLPSSSMTEPSLRITPKKEMA
jgi:anaerobic dimethyl sulfoxide reductase subunit B (iron-sulfur subunit)